MWSIIRKINNNTILIVSVMTLFLMASYFLSQSASRIASSIVGLTKAKVSFTIVTDMMEECKHRIPISSYFANMGTNYRLSFVALADHKPAANAPVLYLMRDDVYLKTQVHEWSVLSPTIIRMLDAGHVLENNRVIRLNYHDIIYYIAMPKSSMFKDVSEHLMLFLLEIGVVVKSDIIATHDEIAKPKNTQR